MHIRRSAQRGYHQSDWLESYHSFSFGSYYDPKHMGFSVLRVINEDIIAPGMGFGMHGHRDMEIITYMLSGQLQHQDSMGNTSIISAGDVQRMSAGSGIMHSEFNASSDHPAHLLQIWLLPDTKGIQPSYEEKHVSTQDSHNQWNLIAAGHVNAHGHEMEVQQDVRLSVSQLDAGHALQYQTSQSQASAHYVSAPRALYLHLIRGSVSVSNGIEGPVFSETLDSGDALLVEAAHGLNLNAKIDAEMLLFDMPVVS